MFSPLFEREHRYGSLHRTGAALKYRRIRQADSKLIELSPTSEEREERLGKIANQAAGTDRWSVAWNLLPLLQGFDQGERDGCQQRLGQTKSSGDSEGGLLCPSAGT